MKKIILIVLFLIVFILVAYKFRQKDNNLNKNIGENIEEMQEEIKPIDAIEKPSPEQKKIVSMNIPFTMSVGEKVNINNSSTVTFLSTEKVLNCGDDVQTCPDKVMIYFLNKVSGEYKTFSLSGSFQPYKVDNLDIIITKKIDINTYEFKISPTQF